MLGAIYEVLVRPVEFFSELGGNSRRVGGAVWVVLLVAALTAASSYFVTQPQAEALGGGSVAGFILVSAVVFAALASFGTWLLFGLLARMGAGIDAKPWAVVGYAMTPQLLTATLLLIVAALFPTDVTPLSLTPGDPEALREASEGLTREIASSPLGRSNLVLGFLGTAWWLGLIFLGLRETTGDRRKAVRSVVLMGIVYGAFLSLPWLFSAPP